MSRPVTAPPGSAAITADDERRSARGGAFSMFVDSYDVYLPALLNERFPASVRASRYGIGYLFGLILPGLYSVWLLALSTVLPHRYGLVVLIVGGRLLMFAAVRRGPETNPRTGPPGLRGPAEPVGSGAVA